MVRVHEILMPEGGKTEASILVAPAFNWELNQDSFSKLTGRYSRRESWKASGICLRCGRKEPVRQAGRTDTCDQSIASGEPKACARR
jgi:hypothetical protein